jgi:hypothetical protein
MRRWTIAIDPDDVTIRQRSDLPCWECDEASGQWDVCIRVAGTRFVFEHGLCRLCAERLLSRIRAGIPPVSPPGAKREPR